MVQVSLEDKVCHWWDGFIRFGKQDITIRDVMCHRGGLYKALPKDLTLSKLTDYESMISIIENAVTIVILYDMIYLFYTGLWFSVLIEVKTIRQ